MSNQDISRRRFVQRGMVASATAVTSALIPGLGRGSENSEQMTEDGLHYQPWFLESFLELADDLTDAAAAGKHFAIMWELKGCPYCAETHRVNLANDKIRNFLQSNFEILQLNYIGSKRVTDFDGEEISEKGLARKYGLRFTPTFQFFPKSLEGLAALPPVDREVARLPGYLKPEHFLSMFQYVAEEAYKTKSFRDYLVSG